MKKQEQRSIPEVSMQQPIWLGATDNTCSHHMHVGKQLQAKKILALDISSHSEDQTKKTKKLMKKKS